MYISDDLASASEISVKKNTFHDCFHISTPHSPPLYSIPQTQSIPLVVVVFVVVAVLTLTHRHNTIAVTEAHLSTTTQTKIKSEVRACTYSRL